MQAKPQDQRKVRCFGRAAALTVEATPLMASGNAVGQTVNLDVAGRVGDNFDWQNKVTIQLSEDELAAFACVLLGHIPRFHFKRPGKGIEIERQPQKLFVKASAGAGNLYTLPLAAGRVFAVSTLVISRLQEHFGTTDTTVILASLEGAARLLNVMKE